MSRSIRRFHTSLRPLASAATASSSVSSRAFNGPTLSAGNTTEQHRNEKSREPADSVFSEHLNGLFNPLKFPPDLARRILTHGSHPAATRGHNAQLSFMGRRVLESYLLLLITSTSALKPSHDLDLIVSRALNTYILGEHVGSRWGLGRAMRWTPTLPAHKLNPKMDQRLLLRDVGLYKVQGDAVAAVMGGIYHQFGGSIAQRVFHTRLLPHILLGKRPEGIPEAFHEEVLSLVKKLGGPEGPLLVDVPQPNPLPEQIRATV